MKRYQHILLATDLSLQSDQVAVRAKEVATESEAQLSIVHVIAFSPVIYGGEYSMMIEEDLEQHLSDKAQKGLRALGEKFDISPQNQHIVSGSIKLGVVDIAQDIEADLIVVGTHSHHHGLEVFLGSCANAILHHAHCDVLVVKVNDH